MSQKIDSREVLTYLNSLGYINISSQQLKEFITDLRKLIKHDFKHNRTNDFSNCAPPNSRNSVSSSSQCQQMLEDNTNDVFYATTYDQATVASKAKELIRREKVISISMGKRINNPTHEHCIHRENLMENQGSSTTNFKSGKGTETTNDDSKPNVTSATESTLRPPSDKRRPTSRESTNTKKSSTKIVTSQVIRPVTSKTLQKSDPVTLYHQYKSEWEKQKIPGQENHSNLRWMVREKMSNGPKIDLPSRVSRKRTCSWKA